MKGLKITVWVSLVFVTAINGMALIVNHQINTRLTIFGVVGMCLCITMAIIIGLSSGLRIFDKIEKLQELEDEARQERVAYYKAKEKLINKILNL